MPDFPSAPPLYNPSFGVVKETVLHNRRVVVDARRPCMNEMQIFRIIAAVGLIFASVTAYLFFPWPISVGLLSVATALTIWSFINCCKKHKPEIHAETKAGYHLLRKPQSLTFAIDDMRSRTPIDVRRVRVSRPPSQKDHRPHFHNKQPAPIAIPPLLLPPAARQAVPRLSLEGLRSAQPFPVQPSFFRAEPIASRVPEENAIFRTASLPSNRKEEEKGDCERKRFDYTERKHN